MYVYVLKDRRNQCAVGLGGLRSGVALTPCHLLGSVSERAPVVATAGGTNHNMGTRLRTHAHAPQLLHSIHLDLAGPWARDRTGVCVRSWASVPPQRPHHRVRVRRRHATPTPFQGLYTA